jgi:hypothetical protein
MYLPAKTVDSHKKFFNVKRPMPCYTIRAECKVNKNTWKELLNQIIKSSFLECFLSNSEGGTQDNIVWDNSLSSDEDA